MRKIFALFLCALTALSLLSGCSAPRTDYKIAMITDTGAISDRHLSQSLWKGLELIEEDYKADINFFRPSESDTEGFMEGVETLVKAGYDIIAMPGPLFSEAFLKACEAYPDKYFIAVDCELEAVPRNGSAAVFDKSQAGFLAGVAAGTELGEASFGGVFGADSAFNQELANGFIQGVSYAGGKAPAKDSFVFLNDRRNYPLGQQQAALLLENGVNCLMVSSDPTGLGATAETRMRAQAGDEVYVVGSDADMFETCMYDAEEELSCAVTSAVCDYGKAAYTLIKQIIDGETSDLGRTVLFDITSGVIGLPEDEDHPLSQAAEEACREALESLQKGDIVLANLMFK